jgi:hypothetical protein
MILLVAIEALGWNDAHELSRGHLQWSWLPVAAEEPAIVRLGNGIPLCSSGRCRSAGRIHTSRAIDRRPREIVVSVTRSSGRRDRDSRGEAQARDRPEAEVPVE